jgi:hypothetical protein
MEKTTPGTKSKSGNDRKQELWMLVKEIGQIINETSKTINELVIRKVDVSKFREYFNQLQNFFGLVSKNINRPITNHQLNVIKVKLEHSKQDNMKLLETLKSYLEKSERKTRDRMMRSKKKKQSGNNTSKRSRSRTKSRPPKNRQTSEKEIEIEKPKRSKPITTEQKPDPKKKTNPSTSSPYSERMDRENEGMKERYLRKIEKEEQEIAKLDEEVRKIKEQIFDIRTKNTEAIDWHASKVKPMVKAANKKMTMMYLNTRQEMSAQFEEFDEWSKLEHFLKRKIGKEGSKG